MSTPQQLPPPPPPPATGGSASSAGSGGSGSGGGSGGGGSAGGARVNLGHSAPLVTIASPSGIVKPLVASPVPPPLPGGTAAGTYAAPAPAPMSNAAAAPAPMQPPTSSSSQPPAHATIAQPPPPMYAVPPPQQQPTAAPSSYTVVAGDSVASVPYPPGTTTAAAVAAPPGAPAPPPVPAAASAAAGNYAPPASSASAGVAPAPPPPPPPPAPAASSAAAAPPVAQRVIRAAPSPGMPGPRPPSAAVSAAAAAPAPPPSAPSTAPAALASSSTSTSPSKKTKLKSLEEEADAFLLGPIVDPRGRVLDPGGSSSSLSSAERRKRLKPPKLPAASDPLDRVRALVGRRAYVDVLAVTSDLLLSSSAGEWSRFYSYLISGSPPGEERYFVDADSDPALRRVRIEAAELVRHRLTAMMRLRRYSDLSDEVERLNLAENDESRGPLPGWVPVDLRVMAVASAMYVDGGRGLQRCVDGLHRMREELIAAHEAKKKEKSDGGKSEAGDDAGGGVEWLGRVDAALSNAFVRQREWRLALSSLDDVLDDLDGRGGLDLAVRRIRAGGGPAGLGSGPNPFADPADGAREDRCLRAALGAAVRVEVRSRQGRALLQSGGCDEAEEAFALAADEIPALSAALEEAEDALRGAEEEEDGSPEDGAGAALRALDSALVRNAPTQVLINDGLLLFSRQRHSEALDRFLEAIDAQREEDERRRSLLPPSDSSDGRNGGSSPPPDDAFAESVGLESDPSLLAPALNNGALCALYTCRMRDAVSMMESLVREDPTKYLTERLAFNLCTLYELGSDGATSERRKRVLQAVAKRFFLHDVGSECFRIN